MNPIDNNSDVLVFDERVLKLDWRGINNVQLPNWVVRSVWRWQRSSGSGRIFPSSTRLVALGNYCSILFGLSSLAINFGREPPPKDEWCPWSHHWCFKSYSSWIVDLAWTIRLICGTIVGLYQPNASDSWLWCWYLNHS